MSSAGPRHSDVLVVGGGVIGLACAHYLAQSGRSVRIVDRDSVGAGACRSNCGLIFTSDLPPLCAPGVVGQELRRTLRGTSPLRIRLRSGVSLVPWLLGFAANCRGSRLNHAVRARESLLRVSAELLRELIEQEAFAVEYEQRGVLMAFKDPKVMADYEKTNRLLESYGLAASFHDRTAVRRLEPALNDGVCGGWHHRADSHLRPESLLDAWTAVIEQAGVALNGGCTLEEFLVHGDTVTGARTTSGDFTADACVLAAGVWSPRLARQLKLRIPVAAGKGYSLTMERPAVCPSIPCYLYERSVVATPWSSGYRLGGTMEFAGFDTRLNERRLESLKQAAAMYLRAPLGRAIGEPWAGLRPMCVDDLPIIDRAPGTRNLYLATGHGMLGLSTATGTGRLLGDLILGRPPCIDPEPYSIGRFGR